MCDKIWHNKGKKNKTCHETDGNIAGTIMVLRTSVVFIKLLNWYHSTEFACTWSS